MIVPLLMLFACVAFVNLYALCVYCSHPEGATDAMQSSLTEPMLNTTGNASSTQRLLEGQTDATATAKTLIKPDAWVQAGKTLFQRATGRFNAHYGTMSGLQFCSSTRCKATAVSK